MPVHLLLAFLVLFASPVYAEDSGSPITPEMQDTASELIRLAVDNRIGYELVESLTTEIGPRLAGSEAEKRARFWAVNKLEALGFENVRVEEFKVPLWQRRTERAEILSPFPQPLAITALGASVSTGPQGVRGEVVSFPTFAALAANRAQSLEGKIVFIDEVMTRTQDGSGYGVAAKKRRETAYEAQRQGAKAALIRSVGTSSHRFPHTGQMHRAGGEILPSVPTAALAAPDADQLARALSRGQPVTVQMILETETRAGAISGNVIAEIPGRDRPEEIVIIGAHLDSWDLATGAVDDGAGVGIVVGAAKLLMDTLSQPPKRTVRVVLFGSEEVGLVGAKAYALQHADELDKHIIGAESDFGAGKVWRFDTRVNEQKLPLTRAMAAALSPLGIVPGANDARGGPDMHFIREAGVPVASLVQNGLDYFDLHHTANDTFDKIDREKLAQNIAAFAVFTYLAAEMDEDFR